MCYINGIWVGRETYIQIMNERREMEEIRKQLQDGFSYQDWPLLIPSINHKWEIVNMQWGFIPSYIQTMADVEKMRRGYNDATGRFHPPLTMLNAVGEELLLPKKVFRNAALYGRCLVLSTGFYEHRHIKVIGKRGKELATPEKFPYHITVKGETPVFFMAGIYQPWTDKSTGETINTFAIVTTDANPLMRQIHNSKNRMPVILPTELAEEWITPGLSEQRIDELATYQYPSENMKAWTVGKDLKKSETPSKEFDYGEIVPALI
jgi:putative SOS response-associated peptidase YedK